MWQEADVAAVQQRSSHTSWHQQKVFPPGMIWHISCVMKTNIFSFGQLPSTPRFSHRQSSASVRALTSASSSLTPARFTSSLAASWKYLLLLQDEIKYEIRKPSPLTHFDLILRQRGSAEPSSTLQLHWHSNISSKNLPEVSARLSVSPRPWPRHSARLTLPPNQWKCAAACGVSLRLNFLYSFTSSAFLMSPPQSPDNQIDLMCCCATTCTIVSQAKLLGRKQQQCQLLAVGVDILQCCRVNQ